MLLRNVITVGVQSNAARSEQGRCEGEGTGEPREVVRPGRDAAGTLDSVVGMTGGQEGPGGESKGCGDGEQWGQGHGSTSGGRKFEEEGGEGDTQGPVLGTGR